MKVLDLSCSGGHAFEGWFASEEDYQTQTARGLLECPMCADRAVSRMPSAPRLNLSGASQTATSTATAEPQSPGMAELQKLWIKAVRHVITNTEDVGTGFAEEARRIHYGESEQRGIRGQASAEEARSLVEEGIEIALLPLPDGLKEPLQ